MDHSQAADKRVARSKAAVLAETYRQMTQGGLSGVSIDEVSRISGVSKTTIYRHWPSRSALLMDACSRLGEPQVVPDTGSFLGDVRALARHLGHQLQSAPWSSVYPSIIDAAERDSDIAATQSKLQKDFMAPFNTIVERAKVKGAMPRGKSAEDLIAATVGPLFYRRWFSREPIDEGFIDAIAAAAVAAAVEKKSGSSR